MREVFVHELTCIGRGDWGPKMEGTAASGALQTL